MYHNTWSCNIKLPFVSLHYNNVNFLNILDLKQFEDKLLLINIYKRIYQILF